MQVEGMPELEHYPYPPPSDGSLGVCHRRPCGLDTAILTPFGLIIDPVEQIRWFMRPGPTPSFDQIIDLHIQLLMQACRSFMVTGTHVDHAPLSREEKLDRIRDSWEVVNAVRRWQEDGYPIDREDLRNSEQKNTVLPPNPPPLKIVRGEEGERA